MDKDAVISFLYGYTGRMGYAVSESDILLAYPKKDYRFTNAKIVDMLGNCAKKYFAVKEKETKKKKHGLHRTYHIACECWISIRVIALALHISTSKVKRITVPKSKRGPDPAAQRKNSSGLIPWFFHMAFFTPARFGEAYFAYRQPPGTRGSGKKMCFTMGAGYKRPILLVRFCAIYIYLYPLQL